jgi:hypothetical protein
MVRVQPVETVLEQISKFRKSDFLWEKGEGSCQRRGVATRIDTVSTIKVIKANS